MLREGLNLVIRSLGDEQEDKILKSSAGHAASLEDFKILSSCCLKTIYSLINPLLT